jgi:AcrR family transcriptional regulator
LARTVNTAVRAVRYDAFVDAAQKLIQAKGYEQMSIQDVLDELDASRGAFYHYFDSKVSLLEAVVERMVDAGTESVRPVLTDSRLTAAEKLRHLFTGIADWKVERKDLMLALVEVWYSDDNAIVRDKVRQATVLRLAPMLAEIIRQGKAEGQFTASSPHDAALAVVALLHGAQDNAGALFAARKQNGFTVDDFIGRLAVFMQAIERVLGVPDGSLMIVDREAIRVWFD